MNENEPKVEMPEPPAGHRWEYRGMGWDNGGKSTVYCHTTYYSGVARGAGDRPSGIDDYHYWEAVPHPVAEENRKLRENLERENAELRNVIDRESEIMGRIDHITLAAELGFTKFRENPEMFLVKVRELKAELTSLKSPCVTAAEPEPAAYPPPESEWPEKPAPPEGCEWVRMPMSADRAEGFDYIMLSCKGVWESGTYVGNGWQDCVVFRAEKIDHTEGGKYRMLEEGEKLEPSDQYFWHDRKEWDSVFGCAGYNRPFSKAFWGSDVRRLVTPQPDFAQQAKDILQARFVTGFPAFREITLDHFVDLIIKATKQ